MRQNDNFTAVAWNGATRIVVVGLLVLSGFQFLSIAVVYRTLGASENDNMIFAGSLLFAGAAFAFALAFRKAGAPTWKHKAAVAVIAFPAALSLVIH
jgi:hypothetical protein